MQAEFQLQPLNGRAFLLEAELNGETALHWATSMVSEINRTLDHEGALLVRGLNIESTQKFGNILSVLFGPLCDYVYRSTPRTKLSGNVFTATEYPSSETIPQHNENAYSDTWPMRIGFFAFWPSASGGNTPLADSRRILQRLPKDLVDRFIAKGVMYVRNYGDLDLPWSEVFQTESKAEVEAYCVSHRLEFAWQAGGRLRTWQINPAIQSHPVTGELAWFNQAHLFHVSSHRQEIAEAMLAEFGEGNIPRNAYFGDGSTIPIEDLDCIRDAIAAETFSFPWKRNDLLLLDNMHFMHGRQPFEGQRKVLVGMGRPVEVAARPSHGRLPDRVLSN